MLLPGNVFDLAFHHHRGHCQAGGVGEGKGYAFDSEFIGQEGSPSAQFKNGPPAWFTLNLELTPRNSPADTRSQSFRSRLFGGEARGKAFRTGALAVAIGDLTICINAAQKA